MKISKSYIKADARADYIAHREERKAYSQAKKAARRDAIIAQIVSSDDPLDEAFKLLVPADGKASKVAGELVRAMMRIIYRDYNDGDLFYDGYGIETCADCVAYICETMSSYDEEGEFNDYEFDFTDIAENRLEDSDYTEALENIAYYLIKDLTTTDAGKQLFSTTNNSDMYQANGEKWLEDRDLVPSYDLTITLPDQLRAHIDAGHISDTDLQWELKSWDGLHDAEIDVYDDEVVIIGLSREDYEEVDSNCYRWLEDYASDLDDEYGDPYEEDEDDYDEDEE